MAAVHWHILGAGAIGCLWATHLAKAGHRVTLIVRTQDALNRFNQQGGITLEHENISTLFTANAQLADTEEPIHNLLLTTKAYDTKTALASVQTRLSQDAQIVILQNGMGAQQSSAEQLAPKRVWAASTTDGAWLKAPFHVVFAGQGATRVGPLNATRQTDLPTQPQGMTPAEPMQVIADADIEVSLWRKLVINCAINPLTALYDCRNGELVTDPDKYQHMTALCEEMDTLCNAKSLTLFDTPIIEQAAAVATATGANYSSMLQDVRQQRRTELDFITGYLLKIAGEQGLNLPQNQSLYKTLTTDCKP